MKLLTVQILYFCFIFDDTIPVELSPMKKKKNTLSIMHELGKENTNIFTENTYVFFRILIYRLELKRHSSVYTHKVTVCCLRKI